VAIGGKIEIATAAVVPAEVCLAYNRIFHPLIINNNDIWQCNAA